MVEPLLTASFPQRPLFWVDSLYIGSFLNLFTIAPLSSVPGVAVVEWVNRTAYVVVQFYPWFKFSFLLFQTHYHVINHTLPYPKQKKIKFEPRIKLNHNTYSQ